MLQHRSHANKAVACHVPVSDLEREKSLQAIKMRANRHDRMTVPIFMVCWPAMMQPAGLLA